MDGIQLPKTKPLKNELLLIGHPKRVSKVHNFQLLIGENTVKPSACARNLGVYFDSTLSFKSLVNKTAAPVRCTTFVL